MKSIQACFLALLAPLLLAVPASGAVILWDAAAVNVNTSDPTQVSSVGTFFAAVDIYSGYTSTGYTVNTTTFTSDAANPNVSIGGDGLSLQSNVTTNTYVSILNNASAYLYVGNSPSKPIVLSGLTNGQSYQIQLWTPNNWNSALNTQFSGTGDNTDASPVVNTGVAGGQTSQYILGTFTASGTSQNVYYWAAPGGSGYAAFAALQLRAVPEPTTVALLAFGGLALVLRSRIRRRKLIA